MMEKGLIDLYGHERIPVQRKLVCLHKDDLEWGRPGQARYCPVALRLKAIMREEVTVSVGSTTVSIFDNRDHRRFSIVLPQRFQTFITGFDAGHREYSPDLRAFMELPKYLLRQTEGKR